MPSDRRDATTPTTGKRPLFTSGELLRLEALFLKEGEPYPYSMAVFVANNTPDEARRLLESESVDE